MVSFKSLYQTQVTETGVIFNGLTQDVDAATTSIADGASDDLDVNISRAYLLCCIETDVDALVRVYGSSAGRTADARAAGVPPTGAEESLIAEVDTTGGNLRIDLSPSVVAVNSDVPQSDTAYLRVFNQSGGPSVVNTTLTTSTVGSSITTAPMSRAEVLRTASFPIPSPTAPIPIIWDLAPIDSGGMTDIGGASPERITIVQDGRYVINGTVQTDAPSYIGSGATETVLLIGLNGTIFLAGTKPPLSTSNPILNVTVEADLFVGDYLTLEIAHDGGAAGPITTTAIAPPNDFPKFSVIQVPDAQGGGGDVFPGKVTTNVITTGSNIVVQEDAPEFHFVTPSANITFSVPATPSFERRYVVKHDGVANTIDVDDGTSSFGILSAGQDIAVIYSTVDASWRIE